METYNLGHAGVWTPRTMERSHAWMTVGGTDRQ